MVDPVEEGYLAWALIGQNKFTVHVYRDWTTVKMYSTTTDPSKVCAPQVCVGSVKLYSKLGQTKCVCNNLPYKS